MVPSPFQTQRYWGIYLRNYYTRDGKGYGLVEAVWLAWIEGFNLMILTENNIIDKAYFIHNMGYEVVLSEAHTTADGNMQEGMGMIV